MVGTAYRGKSIAVMLVSLCLDSIRNLTTLYTGKNKMINIPDETIGRPAFRHDASDAMSLLRLANDCASANSKGQSEDRDLIFIANYFALKTSLASRAEAADTANSAVEEELLSIKEIIKSEDQTSRLALFSKIKLDELLLIHAKSLALSYELNGLLNLLEDTYGDRYEDAVNRYAKNRY